MAYPAAPTTAHVLEDGGAAITAAHAGEYASAARVYDFGADTTWNGLLIVDVSAIVTGTGRSYELKVQLSNASDFSSGVIDHQPFTLAASPGTEGQIAIVLSNKIIETKYRYARLYVTPTGSGASITLSAWIIATNALSALTNAELVNLMGIVAERFNQATQQYRAWAGGVITGGPDSNGKYPLSDASGTTYLIECPAKIVDLLAGGLTKEAIEALTEFELADIEETDPEPYFIGVVGPTGSRVLRKFSPYIFTSRKTKDLEPFVGVLSTELLPALNEATGIEYKIAVGEIMRQTTGMINPQRFGVKPDCFSVRRLLAMEIGTNIVECEEPFFITADVGKAIQVGGAGGSGAAMKGAITDYLDAWTVEVSFTASATVENQDGNWGTLNTVGMQAALTAAFNPNGPFNYGAIVLLPPGGVLCGALYYWPRTGLVGQGTRHSTIVRYADAFNASPGAFQKYDGDTTAYPITQYADGSYYYPIYPNSYVSPHYSGSYVPEIAPTLCNRIGVDKDGVSWTTEGASGVPAERGYKVDSDFNVMANFALDGSRYCATNFYPGMEFRGGLFSGGEAPYHQVDPYLRWNNIEAFLHGWFGFQTFGQCSGILTGISAIDNGSVGWHQRGFDNNISSSYVIGNAGPGIISEGSNTNYTTMKISFNGNGDYNWLWGSTVGRCNLYAAAIGDNWNNSRVQESLGANIVVNAPGNEFTGCHSDDAGCIGPEHGYGTPTWITPAILVGPDGDDLRLNDFGVGALVHPGNNRASHAIYWLDSSGMGERTTGRMYTKSITTWYQPGSLSGDQTPNEWGADGGSVPTGTDLLLNGVDISTL